MKKILLVAALVASMGLAGCSDPTAAKRAVENMGMSQVETGGYSFFACAKDDNFATKFTATNSKGDRVSGTVCSAWLKGSTVRFD
jgi:outer membrane murein-binding lipoprotein Lpp